MADPVTTLYRVAEPRGWCYKIEFSDTGNTLGTLATYHTKADARRMAKQRLATYYEKRAANARKAGAR